MNKLAQEIYGDGERALVAELRQHWAQREVRRERGEYRQWRMEVQWLIGEVRDQRRCIAEFGRESSFCVSAAMHICYGGRVSFI